MFNNMLRDIACAFGPSGRESAVAQVIKEYVSKRADKITTDALGNLIALRRGTSGKRVMLSAHMDQIGYVVTDIDEKGFLRIAPVGGIGAQAAYARAVVFENGTAGVVSVETKDYDPGKPSLDRMFIDIGASSGEEAERQVSIGDMAVYAPAFRLMGGKISCAALDNRVSCAIAAQVFLTAETTHDLYAVFTAQEEVGLRGARVAAYGIDPDFALNFDVTGAGDTPNCAPLALALGKGAAVKVMDRSVIVPVKLRDFLTDCAREAGVSFQMEVLPYGGTDTGAIQASRAGVLACCVSIPCRYIHTAHEMADAADVAGAVAIAKTALSRQELPEA